MPIGLVVWDTAEEEKRAEAIANGDGGGPRGRELEIADLLRFMKAADIDNVVWLTADVHYTAAHYYDPPKRSSPTSIRSGNSCPGRCMPAPSGPTTSTPPSARRCVT